MNFIKWDYICDPISQKNLLNLLKMKNVKLTAAGESTIKYWKLVKWISVAIFWSSVIFLAFDFREFIFPICASLVRDDLARGGAVSFYSFFISIFSPLGYIFGSFPDSSLLYVDLSLFSHRDNLNAVDKYCDYYPRDFAQNILGSAGIRFYFIGLLGYLLSSTMLIYFWIKRSLIKLWESRAR
jgi:hypothetical protein